MTALSYRNLSKEIDIPSKTEERDPLRHSHQESRLEANEMTQKTKCKLLFFSIWPGVQCGTRFIEDPVCNYALRRHLQLFSYILFAHRERHGDTSPSSEKFVLSVGWLTISDEGVVKKLDTLRRKNLLQLFRDFLILRIFNILDIYDIIFCCGAYIQLRKCESIKYQWPTFYKYVYTMYYWSITEH